MGVILNKKFDIQRPMQVGGQAVLEGVMMRGPATIATAVRKPDGTIVVKKDPFVSFAERYRLLKLPILRGAAGLVEMLAIGIRTLNFSAEVALEEPVPEKNAKTTKGGDTIALALTVGIALLAGMAIFFATPLLVTSFLFGFDQDPLLFNLVAGAIRMVIFLAYLGGISLLKDVQRLFQYHGAEHKSVFAFEKGQELTPASAALQSRFHPRCGTSFLLVVMLSAILLFALLDAVLILWLGKLNVVIRLVTHLPLIPLVGGISYEFIKLSAKKSDTVIGKLIVAPGLWLQKITTREPDASQLEVALVALKAALGLEQHVAVSYVETPEENVKEFHARQA